MEVALVVVASLLLAWFIVARVMTWRQKRRRKLIIQALGSDSFTRLDLPAVDLMEKLEDPVCLVYWTKQAMAWQYTRRQDVIRMVKFEDLSSVAFDPRAHALAIETRNGDIHVWQFRASSTKLDRYLLGAIAKARPDVRGGDELFRRIESEIGPLA
jgi:hypothetical protein